jgi:hypothetical protein
MESRHGVVILLVRGESFRARCFALEALEWGWLSEQRTRNEQS